MQILPSDPLDLTRRAALLGAAIGPLTVASAHAASGDDASATWPTVA